MTNSEEGCTMEIAEGERRNIEECGRSWNHQPLIHLEQRSRYRCQSNQWFINRRANSGDRKNKERVSEEGEGKGRAERETDRDTREKDAQEAGRQRRERMIS